MFKKEFEDLTLADDFMFCAVFEENPELCRELLRLVLGTDVGPLEVVASQKSLSATSDSKGVRFDIYTSSEDTVYDLFTVRLDRAVKDVIRNRPNKKRDFMNLKEMLDAARQEGEEEGREEGREEGQLLGEQRILSLVTLLMQDGRLDDLNQMMQDAAKKELLLEEYGLLGGVVKES